MVGLESEPPEPHQNFYPEPEPHQKFYPEQQPHKIDAAPQPPPPQIVGRSFHSYPIVSITFFFFRTFEFFHVMHRTSASEACTPVSESTDIGNPSLH
jgi:hypothetical protein